MLYTLHGDFGRALKAMHNGLRIASKIGHREWVVAIRFGLGILHLELFAPDQSRRHLEKALTLAKELRSPMWMHLVCGAFARAYSNLDDRKSAETCLASVICPRTPMDTLGKRYCWAQQAEMALWQDDPALALDITERLIASAPGWSPGHVITYLWMLKGEALAAMGRAEQACSLMRAAIENARATGERFLLWRVHASLGRLFRALSRQSEAEREFSHARALVEELADTVPNGEVRDSFLQRAHERLRSSPWHIACPSG
jgi:tetratricopeptide (TPR) repeat protein